MVFQRSFISLAPVHLVWAAFVVVNIELGSLSAERNHESVPTPPLLRIARICRSNETALTSPPVRIFVQNSRFYPPTAKAGLCLAEKDINSETDLLNGRRLELTDFAVSGIDETVQYKGVPVLYKKSLFLHL
eukprot:m.64594 g.64594  ORF g.64594 m.64594 type:complete len:132 (+) comp35267_c0_seq4:674-1069(+)